MKKVLIPGSFDPITVGHYDVIKRCSEMFDEVYVVVFQNTEKRGKGIFTGKDCFEFRCKGENMAFASATDRSCVECTTSLRGGVSPVDGTCVKCDSGKVFNNKATTAAVHCGDATAYTKTDMQYGKGKTKNNNPEPENQCWTKTETDVYRECVTSGATSASES